MKKWLVLLMAFHSQSAHAYFQMDFMKAKNSPKATSKWTIGDWIAQRNKMALADHWLTLNKSASIFEINTAGGVNKFKVKTTNASGTTTVDRGSVSYQLDMYVSIFNLMGEFEKMDNGIEVSTGAAGVRLLGNSSQT